MTDSHAPVESAIPVVPHTKRERQLWMDLLRGLAILLVVAFHSVTILERHAYTAAPWMRDFNQLFVLYRMPTLVFLSGLLLAGSFGKGIVLYLLGKGRRIFWPLLVWTLIYALVIGPMVDGPMQLLKYLSGQSYLWFLTFILIYYLAAIPLRRLSPLLVAAVAFGIAILAPDGSKNGERLFYLMAFFFLGSWVGGHWALWMRVVRSRAALLGWIVIVGASAAAVVYELHYGPLYAFPALCFIIAVSATAFWIQAARWCAPLIFMGQHSLIFYVSHFPTIYIVMGFCRGLGVKQAEVATMVAFPVALLVGLLLVLASRASWVVDLLFVAPAPPQRVVGALQAVEKRLAFV
ncbi:acyltransferase [Sphingobium sp. CFD-1]|uniref:acyltransferase family protein n=1 Tax=Sphingobium sp. CFD-1 TaxID=2878545 RepID=UPI00214D0C7C|nr:acyltransferase [Sphingobium sp. CFD-1]